MTRFTHQEMAEAIDRLVYPKASWLADFSQGSRKRADHEIDTKRHELAVLKQAGEDYHAAARRSA